jgi:hypothetical protein
LKRAPRERRAEQGKETHGDARKIVPLIFFGFLGFFVAFLCLYDLMLCLFTNAHQRRRWDAQKE